MGPARPALRRGGGGGDAAARAKARREDGAHWQAPGPAPARAASAG